MNVWWWRRALFALVGGAACVGSVAVFVAGKDALLREDAWRNGMELAGYIERELPTLDAILQGTADRRGVEADLQRLASIGDVFRFEFLDAAGTTTFATGSFHPSPSEQAAVHHAHQHLPQPVADVAAHPDSMHMIEMRRVDYPSATPIGSPVDHSAHHQEVISKSGVAVEHRLEIQYGDGNALPGTYAEILHPMANSQGGLRGTVRLLLDLSARAAIINKVLLGASIGILALFLIGAGGPVICYFIILRDKKTADDRVHFLARHDALTGLLNRDSFMAKLEAVLAADKSVDGANHAVHFVDVDNFKRLNDGFGHDLGDGVLRSIAAKILALLGSEDFAARLGGDEFAILQVDVSGPDDVAAFAAKLVASTGRSTAIFGHTINATVSIGSAISTPNGPDATRLLKNADIALYQAKAAGRNRHQAFEPWMDQKLLARQALEARIIWAVEENGFTVNFQPLHASDGTALLGFEALLRLEAEDGTPIPPDKFIPLAEEMRLIEQIGAWVLNRACQFAQSWPDALKVAVNLSPAQFESRQLVSQVRDALNTSGLSAARLELEITESLFLENTQWCVDQLLELKALGVSIVMDDFGTGYSSLAYLWQFPFDKIKIDRSFMVGFDKKSHEMTQILKTIVGLGHTMQMSVTAEGVETQEQLRMLQSIECDQIQGFLLGRPMSEAKTISWLVARGSKTANTPNRRQRGSSRA